MGKRIRKEDSWKEISPTPGEVEGDTLEQRREARNEQLYRYASTMSEESKKGVLGYVTQWTPEKGVQGVRTKDSLMSPEQRRRGEGLKDLTVQAPADAFALDPIKKRTPEQRLDSMVQRLKAAHPGEVEFILSEIGAEYWKAGMPVTTAELRTVAAHYLNKAERKR